MRTYPSNKTLIRPQTVRQLKAHYHASLFDDIVPFWQTWSPDREKGGYLTRLERDGHPYSGDKDMWMTGREIWMFSHLYNTFEPRDTWREMAGLGLDFMVSKAFTPEEKMYFRLDRDGNPLSSALSLFTEVFGSIAVAEYAHLAKDDRLKVLAMNMYKRLVPRLGRPSDTPMLGYGMNREFHLHSHDMCRITVARVYQDIWPGEMFDADLSSSVRSILSMHWKPELNALLENVAMDGSPVTDIPEGRLFHPGHSIESAWMIMEEALDRNDDGLLNTALDILIASLEHGWDAEYGGIRYLRNIDGTPCHPLEADLKLWWPHCEALYALLLGWACTGRDDLEKWYGKVHEYTFLHFPDPEFGEWFGYLNRDGSRVWTAKANGWKGFFHIPRALYRCWQLLDNLDDGKSI